MSTDVTFFEITSFSLSSPVTRQGEDDDLLVYAIASPTSTPAPVPIKPPITQVYSQRQNPPVSIQHRLLCHQILSRMMIFQLLSVKVNVNVLTQSLRLFSVTICCSPLVPLLHLLILPLFITLFVRLYLTLVGVVLWWMKCRL